MQTNSFSIYSVTCGMGMCTRTRTCSSGYCQGDSTETQACQPQPCPPECESWSAWSPCDAYCGQGTQKRTRACGYKTETNTQTCLAQQCANWADWAGWSQCSSTCGI